MSDETFLLFGSAPADWLAAAGGIASLGIATAALFQARAAARPRVQWRLEQDGHKVRIVQAGPGADAHVGSISEIGGGAAARVDTPAPRELGPGTALLVYVDRGLNDAYPTEIEVTWREARSGRRPTRKQHKRIFALE